MLSSVLNSEKAIEVNIAIVRTFVLMRQFSLSHNELTLKLKELENKYDKQFNDVFEAINFLIQKEKKSLSQIQHQKIGFKKEA
jgi:hypothetical protein